MMAGFSLIIKRAKSKGYFLKNKGIVIEWPVRSLNILTQCRKFVVSRENVAFR
jgi:hypothetical protein